MIRLIVGIFALKYLEKRKERRMMRKEREMKFKERSVIDPDNDDIPFPMPEQKKTPKTPESSRFERFILTHS